MEVRSAVSPTDWTQDDREEGTERWHRSQLTLMCMAAHGDQAQAAAIARTHYKTIVQRAAFYNWFDQMRLLQGHEVVWPGTAWIVASQFAKFDTIGNATEVTHFNIWQTKRPDGGVVNYELSVGYKGLWNRVAIVGIWSRELTETAWELDWRRTRYAGKTLDDLVEFANAGNKTIFEDVYPRFLAPLFLRGLKGLRLTGHAAESWDNEMIRVEQTQIVEPVYTTYVKQKNPHLGHVLNELMECEDFVTLSRRTNQVFYGKTSGQLALCASNLDVTDPAARVKYAHEFVVKYYKSASKDGSIETLRPPRKYVPTGPLMCPSTLPMGR